MRIHSSTAICFHALAWAVFGCVALMATPAFAQMQHFFDPDRTSYCRNLTISMPVSSVICEFTTILDKVMVSVYNGMQAALIPIIRAVLTLYVAVFGAQILMGTAQLQARDIIARLLKMACVWLFATQVQYGIYLAFNFFMAVMTELGQVVLATSLANLNSNVCVPYPTFTYGAEPSKMMPLFTFFDKLINCITQEPLSTDLLKVIGFFMGVSLVYPPMFLMFSWWSQSAFLAVSRTVMTFLTSIAAITFLIALSPIFLSLMLFQATNHFFENWLRYLTAYVVQVVLVFAIICLWMIMTFNFVHFFGDLANLIFEFKPGMYAGATLNKTDTWSICPANYNYWPPTCISTDQVDLIPPSKIIVQPGFLQYVFTYLIVLLTISLSFRMLLERVHELSGSIAGSAAVPQLAGGWGSGGFGNATGMYNGPSKFGQEPAKDR